LGGSVMSWAVTGSNPLDAIFTVPGFDVVGVFNTPTGNNSPRFRFFGYAGELYGSSTLPGPLVSAQAQDGSTVVPYSKEASSAATDVDGGAFIICPRTPAEGCRLFATSCADDAECAGRSPGTVCNEDAVVTYCHAP